MAEEPRIRILRRMGANAWRTAVFTVAIAIVVGLFAVMALFVYRGEMSEGPLVLFAGVILGYVLRAIQEIV